jgi:uncharacterized protein (TIGR02118 family)
MIKIVCLMNRKAGMSMADFKAYYETNHVPLINRLIPFWTEYRRNFAIEDEDYHTGHLPDDVSANRPFDVMMEMSFETRDAYQRMVDALSDPEIGAEITRDEENFFDRSSIRVYLVEEHESLH